MEAFDNDLANYQNRLDRDNEAAIAESERTENCVEWQYSSCCSALFKDGTDICSSCYEHTDSACTDCEKRDICNNENKI